MLIFRAEMLSTFENVDTISRQISASLPQPNEDADRQNLLFVNFAVRELLLNAVEHGNLMEESRKVDCKLYCSPRTIYIQVSDEGKGFPIQDAIDETDAYSVASERSRGLQMMKKMGFRFRVRQNQVTAILHSSFFHESLKEGNPC